MSIELPDTVSELILVLENERKIYDEIMPAVTHFVHGITDYVGLRDRIYRVLSRYVTGYRGSKFQAVTSKIVAWTIERYAPLDRQKKFACCQPEYARRQAVYPCDNIDELIRLRDVIRLGQAPLSNKQPEVQPQGEEVMEPKKADAVLTDAVVKNAPAVEQKTFIYGRDAVHVSDSDVFSHIATLEGQIEQLEKIKNKPKKLVAQIENLRADIQALVDFSDSRQ